MGEEDSAENSEMFKPLSADPDECLAIESVCPQCHENGTTNMLCITIPHFREVAVIAFHCPHCGHRNSEVQFAGSYSEMGVKWTLAVEEGVHESLSRQLVKSDSAVLTIPELEFEIPANTQKGQLSTIEGFLRQSVENLQAMQEVRRRMDPEAAEKIDEFCGKLEECADGMRRFTVILNDPAGNCFIETPTDLLDKDPYLKQEKYKRSTAQSKAIGLAVPEDYQDEPEIKPDDRHHGENAKGLASETVGDASALMGRYGAPEEVMVMPGLCSTCGKEADTKMFATNIPYFKEVIIMSTACDHCGYKSSDLRPGGGISEKGKEVRLDVQEAGDLRRDVIKSETATIQIPELRFEMLQGSLGSLITTVEGVLARVKDELGRLHSFQLGDSADELTRESFVKFFENLDKYQSLEKPWTLIIRDPLANSFIAPISDIEQDERLTNDEYCRTPEEDDQFGITALKESKGIGETES